MQKEETLRLPSKKSNSTGDSSNKYITSDKWTLLYEEIAGTKFEFTSYKKFVIQEIRNMKSFNKSNFKPEKNNSIFNSNERLINYRNKEIKFLRDEINNKNLIKKSGNSQRSKFSDRSDFSNFNKSCEKSNSQDEPFIRPRMFNLKRSGEGWGGGGG